MSQKGKLLYYGVLLVAALALPPLLAPSTQAEETLAKAPTETAAGTPKPAAPQPSGGTASRTVPAAGAETVTLDGTSFVAEISNRSTGLVKFELAGDRYAVDGKPMNLVTTDKERYLPLSFSVEGADLGESPAWTVDGAKTDKGGAQFHWEGDGLRITRRFEPGDGPYQLWVTTELESTDGRTRKLKLTSHAFHYVATESEKSPIPFLPVQSPSRSSAICEQEDGVEREDGASLVEEPLTLNKPRFAAAENIYFIQALAGEPGTFESCQLSASERGRDADGEPLGTLFEVGLKHAPLEVAPGKKAAVRYMAYLGPKTPRELEQAGHGLVNAIDTGWFSVLAKFLTWMLRWFYDLIGNWGVAIIVLTFVVKTLLYPLTAKQMKSMARMKELKPEMDRINELYADDREKKGAAMMELYRKKQVNPMAGCLPMLVQLPIWFSLYTSLSTNVELFKAPFTLWWNDLSAPDPFFALPLALGALMFVQQKMTPATAADPMQQKMMLYMMPTMITSFMLFLPAGLCLYMFTNSALSIGQQRLIEYQLTTTGLSSSTPQGSGDEPSTGEDTDENAQSPNSPERRFKASRPSKAERRSRRGK